jgi:hypothetical protein
VREDLKACGVLPGQVQGPTTTAKYSWICEAPEHRNQRAGGRAWRARRYGPGKNCGLSFTLDATQILWHDAPAPRIAAFRCVPKWESSNLFRRRPQHEAPVAELFLFSLKVEPETVDNCRCERNFVAPLVKRAS